MTPDPDNLPTEAKTFVAGPRSGKFWALVNRMRTSFAKARIEAETKRRKFRRVVLKLREEREN